MLGEELAADAELLAGTVGVGVERGVVDTAMVMGGGAGKLAKSVVPTPRKVDVPTPWKVDVPTRPESLLARPDAAAVWMAA